MMLTQRAVMVWQNKNIDLIIWNRTIFVQLDSHAENYKQCNIINIKLFNSLDLYIWKWDWAYADLHIAIFVTDAQHCQLSVPSICVMIVPFPLSYLMRGLDAVSLPIQNQFSIYCLKELQHWVPNVKQTFSKWVVSGTGQILMSGHQERRGWRP